jgi:hypothetical protein
MLVLFICLNLIAPALVIIWGVGKFGPFSQIKWIRGVTNLGLLFFIFPVSITYLIISFNRIFPRRNIKALFYFFPYAANFALYSIKFGFSEGFFSIWTLHSLPLFLGYMFCLITGFLALIGSGTGNLFKNKIWETFLGILLILFFAGTFIFAWISIFLTGLNLLNNNYPLSSSGTAILLFLVSIFLVIGFHFPLLRKLYREGLL